MRLSDHERQRLLERSVRAGAATPAAYIQAAALTAREFGLPPRQTLLDLRDEVIRVTAAIQVARGLGPRRIGPLRMRPMYSTASDRL